MKTTEELLQEQVKLLEKISELKDVLIRELEKKIYPPAPSVCSHVYPASWSGTSHPCCMKCGLPQSYSISSGYTSTCESVVVPTWV